MTTNAEKIKIWREQHHPGVRLTEDLLKEILEVDTLRNIDLAEANLYMADLTAVDLCGANLRKADLSFAKLVWTDLILADLYGADLSGANAHGIDLKKANLSKTNLIGSNLYMAELSSAMAFTRRGNTMAFTRMAPGSGYLVPTPTGWEITIGCWKGKPFEDFRAAVKGEAEWPEPEWLEQKSHRSIFEALLALCEIHISAHPDAVSELAKIHGIDEAGAQ